MALALTVQCHSMQKLTIEVLPKTEASPIVPKPGSVVTVKVCTELHRHKKNRLMRDNRQICSPALVTASQATRYFSSIIYLHTVSDWCALLHHIHWTRLNADHPCAANVS